MGACVWRRSRAAEPFEMILHEAIQVSASFSGRCLAETIEKRGDIVLRKTGRVRTVDDPEPLRADGPALEQSQGGGPFQDNVSLSVRLYILLEVAVLAVAEGE